jgi:hypothetical protein
MHYAACYNSNIEVIVLLLNNGADIYAKDNVRNDSVSVGFVSFVNLFMKVFICVYCLLL